MRLKTVFILVSTVLPCAFYDVAHAAIAPRPPQESRLTVRKPIIISRPTILRARSIKILGHGQIRVVRGGKLTIIGSRIAVKDLSDTKEFDSKAVILLDGGDLRLINNEVVVDTPYVSPSKNRDAPWDEPAEHILIAQSESMSVSRQRYRVRIERNGFTSKIPYSMGLVGMTDDSPNNPSPLIKSNQRSRLRKTGTFNDNTIDGFHGAFRSAGLNVFSIKNNKLYANSFVNLSFSGRNIAVENNRIIYPGRGTTGDGITAMDYLNNVTIAENQIISGSCYGVAVTVNFAQNVTIAKNNIIGGVTNAIYVAKATGASKATVQNLKISSNMMFGNSGFAASVNVGSDITISNNQMGSNAIGFPHQIQLSPDVTNVRLEQNTTFTPIDPSWSKHLALGRSHFTSADQPMIWPAR